MPLAGYRLPFFPPRSAQNRYSAALFKPHTHGLQVLGADLVDLRRQTLPVQALAAFGRAHVTAVVLAAERQRIHGGDRLYAGQDAHGIDQPPVEDAALLWLPATVVTAGVRRSRRNACRTSCRTELISVSDAVTSINVPTWLS